MPALMGISHVDLTVSDCERAAAWWQDVVGLSKGVPHKGIIDIGYGPTVAFRDPDNTQLEFFVHPDIEELQLDARI